MLRRSWAFGFLNSWNNLRLTPLGTMSFLEGLPCSNANAFSGTISMCRKYHGPITRSLGQGRNYLPQSQDTEPPTSQVIKTEEENLLLRYLEKKSREGTRILEKTGQKPQGSNSMHTPPSPFRFPTREFRNTVSDQEYDDIDSSLETPTRLKRRKGEDD